MVDIYYEIVNSGGKPAKTEIVFGITDTPCGRVLVAKTPKGICALWFIAQSEDYHIKQLYSMWKSSSIRRDDGAFNDVDAIYDGKSDLNLHVIGTEFQLKVWRALLSVKKGETVTYKQLAEMAGCPKASRAVGNALNRNPVHYLIPCHRVLKSNGGLGGFAGGVDKKDLLLAAER